MATALACLLPVAALVLVDRATDEADDVTTAGQTPASGSDSAASSLPATSVMPSTTAPVTEPPPPPATAPPTTAPVTEPPPTTAAPPPTPATTRAAPKVTVVASRTPADEVLDLVNDARAAANPACDPLAVDDRLAAAAQGHSDDMAANDYFDHISPDGTTPQDRAEAEGFTAPVGENIAAGQRTPQDVMAAWMASEDHRANIVDCRYTVTGIGLNDDGWYWTQMFGLPP